MSISLTYVKKSKNSQFFAALKLRNEVGTNNGHQEKALLLLFLMNVIESLYDKVLVSYSEINECLYLWHSAIRREFHETFSGLAFVLVISILH